MTTRRRPGGQAEPRSTGAVDESFGAVRRGLSGGNMETGVFRRILAGETPASAC